MTTTAARQIAIFNLVLASLIVMDHLLPSNAGVTGELDSIYTIQRKYGSGRRPAYANRDIIGFKTGETFLIGNIPDVEIAHGTEISIRQSRIFGNNNYIQAESFGLWESTSFFSNVWVLCLGLFSVVISIAGLKYTNGYLGLALVFAFLVIGITSLLYIFWF